MKLKQKTSKVLQMVAPNWMKKLTVANFDVYKLGKKDHTVITGDPKACFMGEIHCYSGSYTDEEYGCKQCKSFCWKVPSMLDSSHSDKVKNALLNEIAEHMRSAHAEIIGNKWLGKD